MFQTGEYVVYGAGGVCEVKDIGKLSMNGLDKEKLYYTLQPIFSKGSTIYTPVENNKGVMRKTISKEDALALIRDIPNIGTIGAVNDRQREEKYKESMKKYDCREWIKVIKTLHFRKEQCLLQGKKISNTDKKYLEAAQDCLNSELSIPLEMPKEKVEDFIATKMELYEEKDA